MIGILGQRFRDTQRKPAPGARLIPGHPFTTGLVSAYVCNAGAGGIITDSTGRSDASGGLSWGGNGVTFDSTYSASFADYIVGTQPYCFFAIIQSSASDGGIMGGGVGSLSFRYLSGALQVTKVDSADIATSANIGASGKRVAVCASSGNATGDSLITFGYGGTLETSTGTAAQSYTVATNVIGARKNGSVFTYFNGQLEMCGFSNRKWSPDEMRAWMATPYAAYWSPSNILYSFPATSSGGTTFLAAWARRPKNLGLGIAA